MALLKQAIVILCLVFLFPMASVGADDNQYGAVFNDALPLKPIKYLLDSQDVDGEILSIEGKITAQCQGDACWFKALDDTGEILVDLKPYDFRTPFGLIGKQVKINGQAYSQGGKIQINAISVKVTQ